MLFFQAGEQIGKAGRILGQIPPGILLHQQGGKVCHGRIVQLRKGSQGRHGVVRPGVRFQRHLQHPVHQGAALVRRKLRPLPGFQPQHILQEITVAAGIVFFQLAGRDPQPPPQQRFQRRQVMHLPGGRVCHPAQQSKALGLFAARGLQGRRQAGPLGVGQGPAPAQTVQRVLRGGGKVGQGKLRLCGVQRLHNGLQRRAEGQTLSLGPAEPQPLCRGRQGLVEADLLPHHPVLEAVRQVDLLRHQGIPVRMGQQARLPGAAGNSPFGQPQHEHIVRGVQTHLACAGQHHGIQCLGDVPQVGGAQQQPEQVLVFGHGHGLLAQQAGHLVQQLHDHVPLPGGFLRRRNALGRADGFHLRRLLFLGSQGFQAEIQRPADGLGVGALHLFPQSIHSPYQQGAGLLGHVPVAQVLFGHFLLAETPGAALEFLPPGRRRGGPGVGIIFQRADLFFLQGAQPRFGKGGQVFGQVGSPGDLQQGAHRRGRGAELRGGGLVAVEGISAIRNSYRTAARYFAISRQTTAI